MTATSSSTNERVKQPRDFFEVPNQPQYESVFDYGMQVLKTKDAQMKATLTFEASYFYKSKQIPMGDLHSVALPPTAPSRPDKVKVINPGKLAKRGKAGTLKSRIALIHSFCHIESYAIDLSWDILIRFANCDTHALYYSRVFPQFCIYIYIYVYVCVCICICIV